MIMTMVWSITILKKEIMSTMMVKTMTTLLVSVDDSGEDHDVDEGSD